MPATFACCPLTNATNNLIARQALNFNLRLTSAMSVSSNALVNRHPLPNRFVTSPRHSLSRIKYVTSVCPWQLSPFVNYSPFQAVGGSSSPPAALTSSTSNDIMREKKRQCIWSLIRLRLWGIAKINCSWMPVRPALRCYLLLAENWLMREQMFMIIINNQDGEINLVQRTQRREFNERCHRHWSLLHCK